MINRIEGMFVYMLKKSTVDPTYWEILFNGEVVQEIKILFPLKKIPSFFKTREEIEPWLFKEEKRLAKEYTYRLLNMRSYSKKLLRQKLEKKGFSEQVSIALISEIDRLGFFPEKELAEAIIRRKIQQGYGPSYIRQYLREKGLDSTLAEIDEEKALQKWVPKFKGKDKQKVISFLMRKGFSLEKIRLYF